MCDGRSWHTESGDGGWIAQWEGRHAQRGGRHAQGEEAAHAEERVACAKGRGGLRSRMDCAMGRVGKRQGGLAIWRSSLTFIHPVGECSPGALWLYASIRVLGRGKLETLRRMRGGVSFIHCFSFPVLVDSCEPAECDSRGLAVSKPRWLLEN